MLGLFTCSMYDLQELVGLGRPARQVRRADHVAEQPYYLGSQQFRAGGCFAYTVWQDVGRYEAINSGTMEQVAVWLGHVSSTRP